MRSLAACAAIVVGIVATRSGRADDALERLPVEARADDVSFDARQRELDLAGNVRVDAPPFHLSSDKLHVRRTPLGVEVKGEGRVAFCPCLGAPLTITFADATIAPPGDLFLRKPTLELFGAPVLWLPYFWLRSPGRAGVLPPEVAYRGRDGVFLGEGVHLPWRREDEQNGLDLRAGAYLVGGVVVDARLRTEVSTTNVRWDHLRDDGLAIDARGAIVGSERATTVAWDVDALRGARGVASTTDLEASARVFDRGTAEAAWRSGGWTLASGVRSVSVRGGGVLDFGAAGPTISARRSEAIGSFGAYDATLDGGTLRGDALRALSFARAEAGALLATRMGPLGASLSARGAGDVADDGERHGADGAFSARGTVALPLVRSYHAAEAEPARHRIEPRLTAGVLGVHDGDVLGALPGRGSAVIRGIAWTGYTTLYNALGRWGSREGGELEVSAGVVGEDHGRARPVLRWRGATSSTWIGAGGEAARVFGVDGPAGVAAAARYRFGRADSLHIGAVLAYREGVDPVIARALGDAPLEPASGFLSREGLTGGARLAVPWSSVVTTTVGADGDLSARELVAARGSIELRDRCGCLVVRGTGAHRIGREGVDVWVTIDLSPPRR